MRQNRLLTLLIPFLSGVLFCIVASCANGPKVTVYISDPAKAGMEFFNQANGSNGFIPYDQTDKFICMNQSDMTALLTYCRGDK